MVQRVGLREWQVPDSVVLVKSGISPEKVQFNASYELRLMVANAGPMQDSGHGKGGMEVLRWYRQPYRW